MNINFNDKPSKLNIGDIIYYLDNSNIEQYRLIIRGTRACEFFAIDLKYNDVVCTKESLKDMLDYYLEAEFSHNLKLINKNNINLTLEV